MRAVSLKTWERGKASDWITSLCSPYNVFWQKSSNSSSGRTQRQRKSPPNEKRCIWFVDRSLSLWFVMQMRVKKEGGGRRMCSVIMPSFPYRRCCFFVCFSIQIKLGVSCSQLYVLYHIGVQVWAVCDDIRMFYFAVEVSLTTRLPW